MVLFTGAVPLIASTLTVRSTADAGGICPGATCTLRQAIATAASGDTINFSLPANSAITLTSAELLINKNLTIKGPGANLLTVQRGAAAANFRIFNVSGNFIATISGLTIANGNVSGGSFGGGIYNNATLSITNAAISGNAADFGGGGIRNGGTLTITNSAISGNSANLGGAGITNSGTVSITNSTLSGNMATSGNGGAIAGGTVILTNDTISGNSASSNGGGVFQNGINGGTVRSRNTIIALNTAPGGPDFSGPLNSDNYNFIGNNSGATISPASSDQIGSSGSPLNPMLGPLQDNGGSTFTRALLAGSPAIDKGDSSGSSTDQRGVGYVRTVDNPSIANATDGDGTDIGAFELGAHIDAVSRKIHGAFVGDINLPLSGTLGIECRRNTGADTTGPNVGRDHQVILTLPTAVMMSGASVTSSNTMDMPAPTATFSVNSNVVTVDLHNIQDARRLTINLTGVSDGTNTNNVTIPMGILLGDTTGNGSVNASDVSLTKLKSGQAVDTTNFRTDVTVSNSINATDVSTVKLKTGTALP